MASGLTDLPYEEKKADFNYLRVKERKRRPHCNLDSFHRNGESNKND